ncbi:MAG TPA: hypothetical protein ENK49_03700 [Gammaproteobacteria bacterium]|nr:hypothetical protein [Gammaproteobacteria bacterium]
MSLLYACGGGGGGGDGSATTVAASVPIVVTTANAPDVAGAAVDVSTNTAGQGVSGVLTASVGRNQPADTRLTDALIQSIRLAPRLLDNRTGGITAAAVTRFSNVPCDSGTFSGSINDADNNQDLSTGDSFIITTSNCNFSGTVMNGNMSIDNLVISGGFFNDIAPYSFSARLQATNLSMTSAGSTLLMNGDMTLSESTSDGVTVTSGFSGNGIEIVTGDDTLKLLGYTLDEIENGSTGAYTFSLSGTISSTKIGGSITVATDVAFSGVGDLDPVAGQATCTGAGNTSVTLIANADGTTVQLLVDTNGDGTNDDTLTSTWASL